MPRLVVGLLLLAFAAAPAAAQDPGGDYQLPCKTSVKVPKKLKNVRATYGGKKLKARKRGRRVTVTLPANSKGKVVVRGKRGNGKAYRGTRRVRCR